MRILDRHVLTMFAAPLLVCLAAFVCMWLVYDLIERLGELMQLRATVGDVARYYLIQIPGVLPMLIPVSVLVAALACVTGLVRSGEMVAMLAGGVGAGRMAVPVIALASLAGLAQLALECTAAPRANREREEFLEELRAQARNRERRAGPRIRSAVYHNQSQHRLWYLRRADVPTATLSDVELLQMDATGRDVWKIFAKSMVFENGAWRTGDAVRVIYPAREEELPVKEDVSKMILPELNETFTQVASGVFPADVMDQGELRTFLAENPGLSKGRVAPYLSARDRQLWSWAPSFGAALVVLGLCLRATRRSGLAGVGVPIACYAVYVLLDQFFFALGKGARIPPGVAVAIPHVIWVGAAVYLFMRRTRRFAD